MVAQVLVAHHQVLHLQIIVGHVRHILHILHVLHVKWHIVEVVNAWFVCAVYHIIDVHTVE
jgi:hypothetical protein